MEQLSHGLPEGTDLTHTPWHGSRWKRKSQHGEIPSTWIGCAQRICFCSSWPWPCYWSCATAVIAVSSLCHHHHCCATALIAVLPRPLPCHRHHHCATVTIALTLLLWPCHHYVTAIIAVLPLLSTCHHYHGCAAAIIAVPLLSLPHQSCHSLPLYTTSPTWQWGSKCDPSQFTQYF